MPLLKKHFFILVLLGLPCLSAADSCMDKAETQLELNQCAGSDFQKADDELNALYKQILSEYADDPEFIQKFKDAQRAWIKFRDAEIEALFPHSKEDHYYGSVYPMCNRNRMTMLTNERIAQLKEWSEKTEEGDVCSGSIKIKK